MMLIGIFSGVILLSIGLALAATKFSGKGGIADFLVGGRSFPAWLVYFLAVGEVYSIGALVGFTSGVYAKGASYGVWFVGYILLAYVLGYFLAPLVWRAGNRYDAMTPSDVFGRHFGDRGLELISCVTLLLALVPWGQYQLLGLQVVLGGLGIPLTPVQCVVIAALIAFVYIAVSGVRSPAAVSILKDTIVLVAVFAVGIAAVVAAGGTEPISGPGALPRDTVTMTGSPLVFAMSTIIVQSAVFYLGFGPGYIFPARSERAVKSSTVWMPLYLLIYPFLMFFAYYAVRAHPGVGDANAVFMVAARGLLPDWLLGVVAAAAGLSGLIVLSVTALAIGALVSRNIIPSVRPAVQRRWTTGAVAVFLVLAAVLTLYAGTLMLTVLNLSYMIIAQVVPAWLAVFYSRRARTGAVSAGMVVGTLLAIGLYLAQPDLAGVNVGLVSVLANLAVVVVGSALGPGSARVPVVRTESGRRGQRAREPSGVG